tara:strand:- start:140 stop:406 length:267 start_codon:yes stop_codon:yes gene_type:complete
MPSTSPNTKSKEGNVGPLSKKGTFMSKHCLSKYGEAKTGPINMGHPMKKTEPVSTQRANLLGQMPFINREKDAMNMNHPMTKKGRSYK